MTIQEMNEKRRDAAEEVAWGVMLAAMSGNLRVPREWKEFLSKPMEEWAILAVDTGILEPDDTPVVSLSPTDQLC